MLHAPTTITDIMAQLTRAGQATFDEVGTTSVCWMDASGTWGAEIVHGNKSAPIRVSLWPHGSPYGDAYTEHAASLSDAIQRIHATVQIEAQRLVALNTSMLKLLGALDAPSSGGNNG